MNHLLKKFTLFVVTLCFSTLLLSQNNARLFEPVQDTYYRDAVLKKGILLKLNQEELKRIVQERPTSLLIDLPIPNSKPLQIKLTENNILTDDFKVTIAGTNTTYEPEKGLYFKGQVNNQGKSLAAISLFRDKVMGVLAQEDGNYVLGPIDEDNPAAKAEGLYIFYKESDLEYKSPIDCHTEEEKVAPQSGKTENEEKNLSAAGGTVRVYFEADYAMYLEKGSNVNTTTQFITGLYNVVATLYANESITTQISEIKVWASQDPYPTTSSSNALDAFGTQMKANGFNGDLAHLLSRTNKNLGGIAWIQSLCNRNYAFAYTNIGSTYNAFPTYSWTVSAVTHEMGHNLGSHHTHWCGWAGGPIDNCACVDSGPCTAGPEPAVGGGTLMSYCHLSSTSCSSSNPGVNFAYGFGPLPGDKIRQVVNQATCLTGGTTCTAPTTAQLSATNITTTAARLNNAISGVSRYDWQYRQTGTTTWIALTDGTTNYADISSLTAATAYEFQSKVQCTTGTWSDWSASKTFTTAGVPPTCNAPTTAQISATNITATTAQLNTSVTGVAQYDWQYRRQGTTTWTSVNATAAASLSVTGLTASTTYEFQVQVQCGTTWSAWSASQTFTTSSPCTTTRPTTAQISATNITSNTAQLNCAITGVAQYDWQYRRQGTSSWTAVNSSTAASYNATGLSTNTTYQFQVRIQCGTTWSSWSSSQTFTTTSAATCNAPTTAQLSATNITTTTAQLNTSVTGVAQYDWQYRVQGTTTWTSVNATAAASLNVTGLTASTTYEFQVQVQCGTTWSSWSSSQTFTTTSAATCNAPTTAQLSATNITTTTAQLNTSVTGVAQYDWQYRVQGTTTWTSVNATASASLSVTGLTASTTYEFQVQVQCGTTWSAWSSSQTFTTTSAATCNAPTTAQLSATNITTTTAQLNTSVTGVAQYDWQYRVQGTTTWTSVNATAAASLSVTGLTASTTYEFQVQVQCGTTWSVWSSTQTFTTSSVAVTCGTPTTAQLSASNITASAARLNHAVSGLIEYDWHYRRTGTFLWIDLPNTTNNYTDISGLNANTQYQFQVRVKCGTTWTGWSSTKTFITANTGNNEPETGGLPNNNTIPKPSEPSFEIKAYPLPAHDYLSVEFRLEEMDQVTLSLRDLTGKTIQKTALGTLAAGSYTETLQLAKILPGVYLLEMTGNKASKMVKIVVQ